MQLSQFLSDPNISVLGLLASRLTFKDLQHLMITSHAIQAQCTVIIAKKAIFEFSHNHRPIEQILGSNKLKDHLRFLRHLHPDIQREFRIFNASQRLLAPGTLRTCLDDFPNLTEIYLHRHQSIAKDILRDLCTSPLVRKLHLLNFVFDDHLAPECYQKMTAIILMPYNNAQLAAQVAFLTTFAPQLTSLAIRSHYITAIPQLPMPLQNLDISTHDADPALVLPHRLKHLKYYHLSRQVFIPSLPLTLTHLDLSHFRWLESLPDPLPPRLKRLIVASCRRLHSLPPLPKSLRWVDYRDCPRLKNPVLPQNCKSIPY